MGRAIEQYGETPFIYLIIGIDFFGILRTMASCWKEFKSSSRVSAARKSSGSQLQLNVLIIYARLVLLIFIM